MRIVVEGLGVLAWLGGVVLFVVAFTTPGKYPLAQASAPQVAQVYSEATYYAILAVGAFLAGLFLLVSVRQSQ